MKQPRESHQHALGKPLVGQRVALMPEEITGVIVDVVLDASMRTVIYVVVEFDLGAQLAALFQPIRWNLLRFDDHRSSYVANASDDALTSDLLLMAAPVAYSCNVAAKHRTLPQPRSALIH